MKTLLLLFLLLNTLLASSSKIEVKFGPFIDQQLRYIEMMEDVNITEEKIEEIVLKQEVLYRDMFKDVIINQDNIFYDENPFSAKDRTLTHKIALNKRLGHTYAVLRDEVTIASHKVVLSAYRLLKRSILGAKEHDVASFKENMNLAIIKNQQELSNIKLSYDRTLLKDHSNIILNQAQENIQEYNRLIEMNADLIKYLAIYQKEIYTLSKYTSLEMAALLIYISDSEIGHLADPILHSVNLDSIKFFLIIFILLFINIIRKIVQFATNYLLLRIVKNRGETLEILDKLKTYISTIVFFITFHLILIVFTDFQPSVEIMKFVKITYTILITTLFYQAANTIAVFKSEGLQKHTQNIRKEVVNVAIKVANVVIITIGLLFVLHFYGFNLSAVLSGLGIGGLAVAFAARETIANLFGTVSILMSNNYSQGDWIAVDNHEGTIVEIGLRDTIIRTFDNALITIPNAVLANNNVKNWSKRKVGRRIKMHVGVTYQSDFGDIKKAVEEIRMMLMEHPEIATEKTGYTSSRRTLSLLNDEDATGVKRTILVYMDQFSNSSIDILIYCFSKSVIWQEWLAVKEDVMYKIADILKENNLEFAYPTMTLDIPKNEEKFELN